MKRNFVHHLVKSVLVFFLCSSAIFAQEENTTILKSKKGEYYILLDNINAQVYAMGFVDGNHHVGTLGYSILRIDTLAKQQDGTFINKNTKIIRKNDALYLLTGIKEKKYNLDTLKDIDEYRNKINNAYYTSSLLRTQHKLRSMFPLANLDLDRYYYLMVWDENPNKNLEPEQFKTLNDKWLNHLVDTTILREQKYARIADYVLHHLQDTEYAILKDSIMALPTFYKNSTRYFEEIIYEMSKRKPAYILKLIEDYPENKRIINFNVSKKRQSILNIKAVEGHQATKKRLIRDIRKIKRANIRLIVSVLGEIALIVWLITLI